MLPLAIVRTVSRCPSAIQFPPALSGYQCQPIFQRTSESSLNLSRRSLSTSPTCRSRNITEKKKYSLISISFFTAIGILTSAYGFKQISRHYHRQDENNNQLEPLCDNYPEKTSSSIQETTIDHRKSLEMVTLSDGRILPKVLVKVIFVNIRLTVNKLDYAAIFFLYDLKEKASQNDDWTPHLNPFCNTVEIMRSLRLVDEKGHMSDEIKSIVNECIVGEDLDIELQAPSCLRDEPE